MAVVFNNQVYGPGQWGQVSISGNTASIVSVFYSNITLNGTITSAGDTVSFTVSGPIGTFTATQFDSQNVVIFLYGSSYIAISNSSLAGFEDITLTSDGPNDYVVPCFAAGTRIATRRGAVAVEALAPGDEVRTMFRGGFAPITWIGRRHVDCARARHPASAWPLRVRADAFAPGQPRRDLFLSPDHAVFVDGVLIPIRHLENGSSITLEPRDNLTYFHIELAAHDVVLAEGLPSETYLNTGNRGDFAGSGRDSDDAAAMQAARAAWEGQGCAPLHVDGPVVAAIRARLAARASALAGLAAPDPVLRVGWGATAVDHAAHRDGDFLHFDLPAASPSARLISGAFVPAERQPGRLDRRCLGAPVTRLVADGIDLALDDAALHFGWHAPEPGLRWTAGAATLPRLRHPIVQLASLDRAA